MAYAATTVEEGHRILNQDAMAKPLRTIWNEFELFLARHNAIYDLNNAHTDLFLCSSVNRQRQMLFPMKTQLNLEKIVASGADRKELTNAYALELPTDPTMLEIEMEANRNMIKRSQGVLCPILGTERYLTVGAGHSTASIRSSNHKMKAVVQSLAGSDGTLNLTMARQKDPELEAMHAVGWHFKIIKAGAVEVWDKLAEMCEKAQNTQNNIGVPPTEIEIALRGAVYYFGCIKNNTPCKVEEACQVAIADAPPCAAYAISLVKWATAYCGKDAYLLTKISSCAETLANTWKLGHQFSTDLCEMRFADLKRPNCCFVRAGMALFQMTGSKQLNGFGTTLQPKHFHLIMTKRMIDQTLQADVDFEKSLGLVSTLEEKGLLTDLDATTTFANFVIQYLAHLLEPKLPTLIKAAGGTIASSRRIEDWTPAKSRSAFMDNIAACCRKNDPDKKIGKRFDKPDGFDFSKPDKAATAHEPDTERDDASKLQPVEFEKTPVQILKQKGYDNGVFVCESKVKDKVMFLIESVGETCMLKEHVVFSDREPIQCEVQWMNLLDFWSRPSAPKSSYALMSNIIDTYPTESVAHQIEVERFAIYEELYKFTENVAPKEKVQHAMIVDHPKKGIRWGCDAKAYEIVLSPIVPYEKLKWHKDGVVAKKGVIYMGDLYVTQQFGTISFYIEPLVFPNLSKPSELNHVNPFFYVGKTSDKEFANMELVFYESNGFVFNSLRNCKEVTKYDELLMFEAIDAYVPFSSCSKVEALPHAEDAEGDSASEPKRRRLNCKTT
jgi:hypothetical protein